MGGRREHVNIDTTTCDPIASMSKEKIGLKMRVFPQKQKPIGGIGPLAQKDLIQREFCPVRRKGPEGPLPRLSKAVKVTAASNDYHPLKILAKRGRAYLPDGVLCRVFSQKTFETGSKPPHLEGDLFFIGGIGPRSHPQL